MILTSGTSPIAMEPGISVATVSLFYGLMLSELVFRPLRKMAMPDVAVREKATFTHRLPASNMPAHGKAPSVQSPAAR